MCYDSCKYWRKLSAQCVKPKGRKCPEYDENDEEIESGYEPPCEPEDSYEDWSEDSYEDLPIEEVGRSAIRVKEWI